MKLIDKDKIIAEIEGRIKAHKETLKNCDSSISEMVLKGSMSAYQSLLCFFNTLEVKEVDFDKELETHFKECLDVKFPTTDIELIKKDVTYTAKKFFALGLKAQKGE